MSDHKHEKMGYYEIMDRANMIMILLEESLLEHPSLTPKMQEHYCEAENALAKIYVLAGECYGEFK